MINANDPLLLAVGLLVHCASILPKGQSSQKQKKKQSEQCWKSAFNGYNGQISAFSNYIAYFYSKPAQILNRKGFLQPLFTNFISSPVSIPAAILTSPLFFTVRSSIKIKRGVDYVLEQRRLGKIQNELNQNYNGQVSEEMLQKALQKASQKTFLDNGKRLIIVTEAKKKTKAQIKEQSAQEDAEQQFFFVVKEYISLMEIVKRIRDRLGNQSESLHFFSNGKLLNTSQQVKSLKYDEYGIIRISFAKVQTFG